MLIKRKSKFSGKEHEIEIPVTVDQMAAYESGVNIQNAMPNISADHREFILTGTTPEEWNEMMKDLDEEDDDDPDKRYHR